ncbi:MAG TPA: hypothetical protein VL500_01165 [Candidatus Eisenbacteria bacterium]|nr:hypothetical protein [Candidatus Eisenbacteria bacterium]
MRPSLLRFIQVGDLLLNAASVRRIELGEIDRLRAVIHHDGGVAVAEGIQAIDALMALKPSALEGRRLRWARHAWAVHNLIGHPLMQVLAFLKCHRAAMRMHDGTVPRPK